MFLASALIDPDVTLVDMLDPLRISWMPFCQARIASQTNMRIAAGLSHTLARKGDAKV
jgi:hypothetical protein